MKLLHFCLNFSQAFLIPLYLGAVLAYFMRCIPKALFIQESPLGSSFFPLNSAPRAASPGSRHSICVLQYMISFSCLLESAVWLHFEYRRIEIKYIVCATA